MNEAPKLVLKPSLINALVPTTVKYLVYAAIVGFLYVSLSFLLGKLGVISLSIHIVWFPLILVFLFMLPVLVQIIILANTTYLFFHTHVTRNFKFIVVKKHSVVYNQIINVSVDISLWDRLCNAGDIVLHTPEDNAPNLILHYIKEPMKVEKAIYKLIHGMKK